MVSVFLSLMIREPDYHQVFSMLICPYPFMRAKYSTTAQIISTQTFCLLFYQLHSPRWVVWVILGFANGLVVMFTLLGPAIYKTKARGDFCE